MAYFDWNATAPLLPAAREAWLKASEAGWGNPSASYRSGTIAKGMLDACRERIAGALQVDAERVVFTSGATESNNAFIRIARERSRSGGTVWISSIEHPSVREACVHYWGARMVVEMPVSVHGVLDIDWLADRLKADRPELVCLMAVNNETGVIQPWQNVAEMCHNHGVSLFCDAVQWIGKGEGPVDPDSGGVNFSVSAHKFGGVKGTGCLVLGSEWTGSKLQYGGGQEFGERAGTEDVAGIAAMAAAMESRVGSVPGNPGHARDLFEENLAALWPDTVIHGKRAERIWNTSLVSLPVFAASRWISRLDRKGFQVSSGAACSSGKGDASHVLRSMGVEDALARRALRISAGWESTGEDWEALLLALEEVYHELSTEQAGSGNIIQI